MIELAGIVILGIFAQWLAWKTKVPAILPLILIGLLVGPISTLWTVDGEKLIEPLLEKDSKSGLVPRHSLFYFVSLAIGIILFEGGLTLKRREIQDVGPAIVKLITIGALITFAGAGISAHYIMGLSWPISFLFAGLIIVTGPTVIAPILRNVPLNRNVSTVLKWEGILIDPLGALAAVLVFEFIITSPDGSQFTLHAFLTLLKIIVEGIVIGVLAALGLNQLLKRNLVPHYLLNVFTLALVLAVFVLSDLVEHESGLFTVVVMGMVLGNLNIPKVKHILDFKESISILLISILFIILSANIDMEHLELLFDWRCLGLFGVIVFILRPLSVFMSASGVNLKTNDKLFISWVGPRGIVAAGIASLFGIRLLENQTPGAEYITPLVFMVVLGTVLLNATTARWVARILGVTLDASDGILIVGANKASRLIAKYLKDNDRHVVMVDNNESNVNHAQSEGLTALNVDIYSDDLEDDLELLDVGYLMALTSSDSLNRYACIRYKDDFGENGSYRLISSAEMRMEPDQLPSSNILSYTDDFLNLSEAAKDFPQINEFKVDDKDEFLEIYEEIIALSESIPLFIKFPSGRLEIIGQNPENIVVDPGSSIVYLGKELAFRAALKEESTENE